MAVICITGSDSLRLQTIENILLQAGMPAPRPLPKDESIDIRQWQQHVVSSVDGESSAAIKEPGRLWEMLAGEIVLANLKSPLWGWSDPASLRFLDFWLGFAPEFKFLLVCQTPQQLLAERLVNADTPLNSEELLEHWQSQQQEMLRFHHRNPERSLLINASDAVEHPDLLVAACNQQWKLSLAADEIIIPSSPARPDALANFFAYRVASLQPEIDALNREIMATATLFAPAKVEELIDEPQLAEILADYLALRQRLAEEERKSRNEAERLQSELSGVKDALTAQTSKDEAQVELQGKNTQLLLQLEHVQEELETVFFKEQEAKEQLEVLKKEKSVAGEEKAALATKYDDLQQENAQLLSQLHQTQEELETVFSKEQEAKPQLEILKKELVVAGAERAALTAKYDGLQQELAAARLARDEQAHVLSERQKQLDQAVKTKNEQTKLANDRQLQIDELTKDREQLKKQVGEFQKQAEDLVRDHEGQVRAIKELQQENELLLLQLHQTQEELETVFLKEQESMQQLAAVKSVQEEHTRVLSERQKQLDQAVKTKNEQTKLANDRQTQLDQLTKERDQLKKQANELQKQSKDLVKKRDEQISLLQAEAKEQQQENELLQLQLYQVQGELEHYFLQYQEIKEQHGVLALQELARQMEPNDARLRYDEIRLKREQVNPDYEHLWFEFVNLSFAGEIWTHFEFRLSCAHVRPDSFGGFPKLEFPAEGSQAPFEGWFIEASDDFGDKLELRFSLADKALDLGVWERLTAHDRAFMKALAAELPEFLSALRQSGVQIARPWEDWRAMVAEMQSVLTQLDTPLTAIAVTPLENLEANVSSASGLHYDKAKLKREQVNPDYEHLWFEFANLAFSGESWPHFEFRLSCAHVRPDHFGGFPKLEFPAAGSQAPFEGWFIEASDDFGDKLELRFSLPDKALDLGVWERLTAHDRAFMQALVAELPQLLSTLRQSGIKIRRPWEDWTKMAEEMLPIVTNPPKLKGKKKSSFEKLLRRLKI